MKFGRMCVYTGRNCVFNKHLRNLLFIHLLSSWIIFAPNIYQTENMKQIKAKETAEQQI